MSLCLNGEAMSAGLEAAALRKAGLPPPQDTLDVGICLENAKTALRLLLMICMKLIHCLFILLWVTCSTCRAADWYVSTNGSGNGSLGNPWSLQTALTNSSVIQSGDTVWIRGGTYVAFLTNCPTANYPQDTNGVQTGAYEPCWVFGLNGSTFSDSNNPVTFRSYSNEWAKTDLVWRDNYQPTGTNGLVQWGYVRFRDLEFYDSMKGHHATNYCCSLHYVNGPWAQFNLKYTKSQKYINCVFHDVDSGPGTVDEIRGCIFWHVGVDGYEHICYTAPKIFSGNIAGWTVNDVIEHSNFGFLMQSNIIFGSGQTRTNTAGVDARIDGTGVYYHDNYTYNQFTNTTVPPQGFPNGVGFSGDGFCTLSNNVFVAPEPLTFNNGSYTNLYFHNNIVVMNNQSSSYSTVMGRGTTNTVGDINNNQYFTASTVATPVFYDAGTFRDWTAWRSSNPTFDTASTTNHGLPTNMVFVIPNQDEPKRCHVAVYNFASNDVVTVNLAGVLNNGDAYQLYNAQDYGRGAIQNGTYNGTSITVPMTNLTTAPILYGTNWGLFQPPALSPQFGAFVVRGTQTIPKPPTGLRAAPTP